jgi:hypothetical protein
MSMFILFARETDTLKKKGATQDLTMQVSSQRLSLSPILRF